MRLAGWMLAGGLWLGLGGMAEAQEFVRTPRTCFVVELWDFGPGIQCFRDTATDAAARQAAFVAALVCEPGREEDCRAALGPVEAAYLSSAQDVVLSAEGVELFRRSNVLGNTLFSFTTSSTETVTRADATLRETAFATRVTGQVAGGATVFDLTLDVPVTDAAVQAAFGDAALAVTSAGGPGVVVLTPVLIERRETLLDTDEIVERVETADPVETFTLTIFVGGNGIDYPIGRLVDVTNSISGDFGLCGTADRGDGLPGDCANDEAVVISPFGFTFQHFNINTHLTILETVTGTETWEIFEHWQVQGIVQALGAIHAAVQSGGYDLGQRLLRRMGDEGAAPRGFALPGDVTTSASGGPGVQRFGWVEGYATSGRTDADGSAPGERRDGRGVAGGLTWAFPSGLTLGFGLDAGQTDLSLPAVGETGEVQLTQAGVTLGYRRGDWFATGALTYGMGEAETTTLAGDVDHDLAVFGALAETGWHLRAGDWALTPSVGVDYVRVRTDGFAGGGLSAAEQTADRTRVFAGLEARREWRQAQGVLGLHLGARAVHVVAGNARVLPVDFGGSALSVTGASEGRTGLDASLGLTWTASRVSAHLRAEGRWRDGARDHAVTAGLRVAW